MAQLTPKDLPAYVRANAGKYGLDPAAVLAMAQHEGLSGNAGDHNTSFGPWQLHIGGALPSNIGSLGPVNAQKWAWSTDGIDYALGQIAGYARNKTGYAAVRAIAEWERSIDIPGQTARAWASYNGWLSGIPIALRNFFTVIFPGGQTQQIPGEGTDEGEPGQGNPIVIPPITGTIPIDPTLPTTAPAPPTGGTEDVRLGNVGPFELGIPSGLVLGLMGLSLLLIGAILFVVGGRVRADVGPIGGSVRQVYRYGKPQ